MSASQEHDGLESRVWPSSLSSKGLTRVDRMQRRRRRARTVSIILAVVLSIAMVVFAWAVFTYWSVSERIKPPREESQAIAAALAPREDGVLMDEPKWILLLGSDARPGDGDARADSIILVRLDSAERRVTLISVPRDTRVQIPGHGTNKINAATAFGGPALMIRSVGDLTGVSVDHYIKIDFEGFKDAVDAMGGIWIDVESKIDDMQAADHVASAARIDSGRQLLDGSKALTFVRSRAFRDGDYTRMRNQQTFMFEFIRQGLDQRSLPQLPSIASSIASHLDTDMSVRELLDLAQAFKGIGSEDVHGYTIPSSTATLGGVSYVLPDEVALRQLVSAIEEGESPESIGGSSDALDFDIAIINATEVSGAAARIADRLEGMGFTIVNLSSDASAADGRSSVVYRDDKHMEEARLVAHALGDWNVEKSASAQARQGDVVVIIRPSGAHGRRQFLEF